MAEMLPFRVAVVFVTEVVVDVVMVGQTIGVVVNDSVLPYHVQTALVA